VLVGIMLGATLRLTLKATGFSQRWYLPILMLAAAVLYGVLEGRPPAGAPTEFVSTARVIDAPVEACWDAIMFYEEVKHDPPWLLRVGLARPLRIQGRCSTVGDVRICTYDRGRISKLVTEVRPGERLAFDVIEQGIGYERDVRMRGGSFDFESIGPKYTRITLTSEYEPRLWPRWAWRAGERYAIRLLHRHVLEGMRLKAESRAAVAAAGTPAIPAIPGAPWEADDAHSR
jgi:hypothetical protein